MDVFHFIFQESPKITRILTIAFIVISLLTWFEIISKYNLYLNFQLIFKKFQFWRLITNFLFFEEFGLSFIFHLFMFYRYSKMLEKTVFRCNSPDYLYFLIVVIILLLMISPIAGIVHLSYSLCFAMMYYWGRKSKNVIIQMLGMITVRAPYLPWIYLFFSVLFESDFKNDLVGIIAGHTIFFLKDILPRIKEIHGFNLLKTPRFIAVICDKLNLNNDFIIDAGDEVLIF